MRLLLPVAILALLTAGCGQPAQRAAASFDGDGAYAFAAGLVQDGEGTPRFRVPGTAGHEAAAAWLWQAVQVPGWTAHEQTFTGAEYAATDKGSAAFYYDDAGYCTTDERLRLEALAFRNIWAVHDDPDGDRLMLLGAHWDSKRFANRDSSAAGRQQPVLGANDGASGVGVLLQLMRHVGEQDLRLGYDLGVLFVDGEDGFEDCHPLAGSIMFVDQLQPGDVDRFLLLDMVGSPDARFVREAASQACDPTVVDLLHAHAADVGLAANLPGITRDVSDDHVPFLEAGIPAVDLIDLGRTPGIGFPPEWHTTRDTLEHIDAGMLGRVGDLVLAVLQDDAFTATWPGSC